MTLPKKATKGQFWLLALIAGSAATLGIYLTRDYLMDDALITMRYSFNLVRLGQPIWNQADVNNPSMGYTTVLWMLLNSIPIFFTTNRDVLVLVAKTLSIVPLTVIVWLFTQRVWQMTISGAAKAVILLVIFLQAGYGFHLNSAMETLLFSCLLLLATWVFTQKSYSWAAYPVAVLAFLTRPEGAIVIGCFLVVDLWHKRIKRAVLGVLFSGATGLLLLGVLYGFYGDVLPNAYYVKQSGLISVDSVKHTLFFLFTLALPYLFLAGFSTYYLKNRTSTVMWHLALVYLAYYLTVEPLMNVFSRYQWSILVLLNYASLPGFEYLLAYYKSKRQIRLLLAVVVSISLFFNVSNGLVLSYYSEAAGTAIYNGNTMGKVMNQYRQNDSWLVYHDAGGVCYYSDWNCYDMHGLNNRDIATSRLTPEDVYQHEDAETLFQLMRLAGKNPEEEVRQLEEKMSIYGYSYVGQVPISVSDPDRNIVVSVYSKNPTRIEPIVDEMRKVVQPTVEAHFIAPLFRFARKLVRNIN